MVTIPGHRAVRAVLAASALATITPLRAGEIGLAGDQAVLWVYQTRQESPGGDALLRFAFMKLSGPEAHFLPLDQQEIGGAVERAAVRGGRLHVFFPDGTHQRYTPVAPGAVEPAPSVFWEIKLPESTVPLALGGDSEADPLYAVVSGRIAALLLGGPEPPIPEAGPDELASPADTPPAEFRIAPAPQDRVADSAPAAPQPVLSRYCLVRYQRGAWWRDREIPDGFDEQRACLLSASGSMCDLYFTTLEDHPAVFFIRAQRDQWASPEVIAPAHWDHVAAVGIADGEALMVLQQGQRLAIWVRQDGNWVERSAITPPSANGWAEPRSKPTVCLAGPRVAAAWPDAGGQVRSGVWSLSGDVAIEPSTLDALQARRATRFTQRIFEILPFAVLTVTMVFIFTRRRQSVVADAKLRPDQALSSYGRRLFAFALDLLITAPATWVVLSGWLRHVRGDFSANFEVARVVYASELFQRWLAALGIYVVYCIIFEGLRAATPGKLIAGCRVVSEDGERCAFGAILARNLARAVELLTPSFAPILILVFLTRNRQRLGDLVARSVVVQPKPPGHPEPKDES